MQLIHGDCLLEMKGIPDHSIDMILTDPPFGTTQAKWDSVIPLDLMWYELKRIIKPNGAIVLHASQPFSSALVMSNPGWFRHEWIWHKNKSTGHLNVKHSPLKAHESVLVFSGKRVNYYPQMREGFKARNSFDRGHNGSLYGPGKGSRCHMTSQRYPTSLLEFDVINNDDPQRIHPTQKPIPLCETLIRTYTQESEVVLDFCMGSGSTGLACLQNNRQFIGIECDSDYFNAAYHRLFPAA